MSDPEQSPGARGRGILGVVLALLALGGGAALWSASLTWDAITVQRDEPLPAIAYTISGASAQPMVTAVGLIMLAAIVAVLATRTLGRRIVSLVVLVTVVVTAVTVIGWLGESAHAREASLITDGVRQAIDQAPDESSLAIPLVFVSLALGAVAAVLLLVTRNLAMMGSKYERGSAATARSARDDNDPQSRDRDLWSALDRGEDPTD